MKLTIDKANRWIIVAVCVFLPALANSQSIRGTWQLVKTAECIESGLDQPGAEADLVQEMKQLSSPAPQVIKFGNKGSGEESTRILNKKRAGNAKSFLYKVNGQTLLILDKRSQTISESYSIDKLSADSLILSHSKRACDISFFVKIKDDK